MRRPASAVVVLALLVAGVGCSSESTAPMPQPEEIDATADALAFAEALGLPGTNADRETGSAPAGNTRQPCRYNEAEGRWVCQPITRDGLTLTRSFAYLDENRQPMRRFDPLLTAATNTRTRVVGRVERDDARIQIRSAGEMTVSGLLGEETARTLNGREIGRRETATATRQIATTSVVEFSNRTVSVVIPLIPRDDRILPLRRWPLSGQTIREHAITVSANGDTRTERWRETTTFNGTALVPVEIVSANGTRSCVRNLESGALRCE